jgi:hypothetical protein
LLILLASIFFKSLLCGALSKPLLKSRYTGSIGFQLSFAAVACSRNVKRLVIHDLPGLKLWLFFINSYDMRFTMILSFIMDSKILHWMLVRETGW